MRITATPVLHTRTHTAVHDRRSALPKRNVHILTVDTSHPFETSQPLHPPHHRLGAPSPSCESSSLAGTSPCACIHTFLNHIHITQVPVLRPHTPHSQPSIYTHNHIHNVHRIVLKFVTYPSPFAFLCLNQCPSLTPVNHSAIRVTVLDIHSISL